MIVVVVVRRTQLLELGVDLEAGVEPKFPRFLLLFIQKLMTVPLYSGKGQEGLHGVAFHYMG